MKVFKKLLCVLIVAMSFVGAYAQSDAPVPSINSPYSMYGFGSLSDLSFGKGRAMGGVGFAIQDPMEINVKNPASFAAVDSLTMLVDVGMSLYSTKMSDGVNNITANNASFDYIAMQFRLAKWAGITLGYLPFSNVGYKFHTSNKVTDSSSSGVDFGTNTYEYRGNGGIQQAMLGMGFKPFKGFTFGASASFLFGSIDHVLNVSSSNSNSFGFTQTETFEVKDYKLDFGLQYKLDLKDKHSVTLGAVYSYGHKLNSDIYRSYLKNGASDISSYNVDTISGSLYLPHMYGGGIAYQFDDKLTVAADYSLQKWGEHKFAGMDIFKDKSEYRLGVEYMHDPKAKSYFGRIKYRLGAYYSTPYTKIKGESGPREIGVSFGFGLPLLQNRSLIQVSGQYVNVSSQNTGIGLKENMFKINVGITFNERWFMKMKVR